MIVVAHSRFKPLATWDADLYKHTAINMLQTNMLIAFLFRFKNARTPSTVVQPFVVHRSFVNEQITLTIKRGHAQLA